MIIPFLQTSFWLVRNIQYVIAVIFGFTTILFSLAAWYILRRFIPSPLSFVPFLGSTAETRTTRRTKNVKGKDVKPSVIERRPNTRSTTKTRKSSSRNGTLFENLGTEVSSTVGSALILCSIASGLVCAYSLTERGCYTLRHMGIIEWLPWKEGLKCYRTRWDWFADVLGEFMLTILQLQNHEFSQSGMKSM